MKYTETRARYETKCPHTISVSSSLGFPYCCFFPVIGGHLRRETNIYIIDNSVAPDNVKVNVYSPIFLPPWKG